MIGDILEVTRLETGKITVELESVSVPVAVADTVNSFQIGARAKGVTLSSQLSSDLPAVLADHTRLRQILIILTENAIKFTPDGGAVSIQAQLLAEDPRFVLVEVSDTGCGVSPDNREKIFERLYQSSEPVQDSSRKGLGLGLYISKELVTRHGGRIWVREAPQGGSIFAFTLPVSTLTRVMAPFLKDGEWPADSVALVMVEGCSSRGWPSAASREEWSHEVQGVIQHCLLPKLDALLPGLCFEAERAHFFVASFADRRGASSLTNRIRKQLQQSARLNVPGLSFSVSYSWPARVATAAGTVANRAVSDMATALEQAIKTAIGSEAMIH
jgi:hypothetical protein